MGYYTNYELSIKGDYPEEVLKEEIDYYGTLAEFMGGIEDVKWYSWQKDMAYISEKYPDVLFILKGEGEDYPDIWKAYFKNGKSVVYRAVISFTDFNEEDLK